MSNEGDAKYIHIKWGIKDVLSYGAPYQSPGIITGRIKTTLKDYNYEMIFGQTNNGLYQCIKVVRDLNSLNIGSTGHPISFKSIYNWMMDRQTRDEIWYARYFSDEEMLSNCFSQLLLESNGKGCIVYSQKGISRLNVPPVKRKNKAFYKDREVMVISEDRY